jgi:hypothetical protein
MSELTFFASAAEVEIGIRLPWGSTGANAWDKVAATFLDVALGGRGVWIATLTDPSNLDWTALLEGNTGCAQPVNRKYNGRNARFGYLERFDERVARAIIGSSDFQWDSVFLLPRDSGELDAVISTLETIDVRSETFAGLGEFVYSFGDGIGVRWIHPSPSRDIERIKSAGIEHGFTLVPITAADRTRS